MGFFQRMKTYLSSEANSALDKMEDPIRVSEQAIRDLRKDLDEAVKSQAEIKATAIRTKREYDTATEEASDYKSKAMRLLQKAEAGDLEASEGDRLASQALEQHKQAAKRAKQAGEDKTKYDEMTAKIDGQIRDLRSQINQWENELKTLKARSRVSTATKKINKQFADVDSSSTIATLERMRERVESDEALAESYGQMAAERDNPVDSEIDAALAGDSGSDDLAKLKAEMAERNQNT